MPYANFNRFAVGLTGGIGSGKSLVADQLAALGAAAIIDTDAIAHRLTAPNGEAIAPIAEIFGPDYIASDGSLDRAKMRARVFSDASAKACLEAIIHPLIQHACFAQAATAPGAYLVFVVPLLVESGQWRERVDRVLVVDCTRETQVRRVMARSGLVKEQINAIIAAQTSREARLAAADDVVFNDEKKSFAEIGCEVRTLDRLYRQLASSWAGRQEMPR